MKKVVKLYLKLTILMTLTLSIPGFSITKYTVKAGDSLWRISNDHNIAGISNKDMIAAIKGISSKENPSINDNLININQKILIPSTKAEFEDGLKLYNLRQRQYLVEAELTPAKEDSVNEQNIKKGIVVLDAESNEEKKVDNTQIQIIIESRSTSSKWYAIIVVMIVALLIWWRRYKCKKSVIKDDKRYLKEQFYAKKDEICVNVDMASKGTSNKETPKKKSIDDLNTLLKKADELIETHDIADAKAMLQEALNSDAKNLNIRLKILAVYAADGDEISFNSEHDYLASNLLPYDDNRWLEINSLYNKYFSVN